MRKRRLPKYLNKKNYDKRNSSGRIEHQLKEINYNFKGLQEQFSSESAPKKNLLKKIAKYFITLFVSILLVGRISYQINTIFNNSSSALDYKLSHLQMGPPIKNGKGDVIYSTSPSKTDSIRYNFNYKLTGDIAVNSGNIQSAYLVYSDDDNNRICSLKNFKILKFKEKPFSKLIYPLALVPYSTKFFDIPLNKLEISTDVFYSSVKKSFYKPIYILTIDSHNNISAQVLLIKGKDSAISIINPNSPAFMMDLSTITEKPKYRLIKPSDLLRDPFEKSSYLPHDEFEKSIEYITKVAKQYYIR